MKPTYRYSYAQLVAFKPAKAPCKNESAQVVKIHSAPTQRAFAERSSCFNTMKNFPKSLASKVLPFTHALS
jgi:hypothetical protein